MSHFQLHQISFYVVAMVALILALFQWQPGPQLEVLLLVTAVALAGLPHGTLDPLIAKQKGLWFKPLGLAGFLTIYVLIAAATIAFWIQFPVLSLSLFLLFSAWHFGQDWQHDLLPRNCMLAGVTLLSAPAFFQFDAVNTIFTFITNQDPSSITTTLQLVFPFSLLLLMMGILKDNPNSHWQTMFEIYLLVILALTLSPLIYFTVYFCFLHSPRHLLLHRSFFTNQNTKWLMLLLTVLSVLLAVVAYHWLSAAEPEQRLLQLVFVGLAALTMPHMILLESRNNIPSEQP